MLSGNIIYYLFLTLVSFCFFRRALGLSRRVWTTSLEKRHGRDFWRHTRTSRRSSIFARTLLGHNRVRITGFRDRILFALRNELPQNAVVPSQVFTDVQPLFLDLGLVRDETAQAAFCSSRQPVTRVVPNFELSCVIDQFFGKMTELMLDEIFVWEFEVADFATRKFFGRFISVVLELLRLLKFRFRLNVWGSLAVFEVSFGRRWVFDASFLILTQVQLSLANWCVVILDL